VGREKIAIAIEVRDHARKQSVKWIEAVHGKYVGARRQGGSGL
jgi:hypothetical protein